MSRAAPVALLAFAVGCSEEPNPGGTIPCNSAADCPGNLPMCTPDSHICVGCLDDFQTCGPFKTCDPMTHSCVPAAPDAGCRRNADCPRPGVDPPLDFVCEVDSGLCAACVVDGDCPAGPCDPVSHACIVPDLGAYDAGRDAAVADADVADAAGRD